MKVVVSFLFLLAVIHADPLKDAQDFLQGFLAGIEARYDYDDLSKCLKDLTEVFKDMKDGLTHLKTMKLSELNLGVKILLEATEDFIEILQPCWSKSKKLQQLYKEIRSANIMKLAAEILAHPAQYLQDFIKALTCFDKLDYQCAGRAVGDILRVLLLQSRASESSSILEFLKGLLEGIDAPEEFEKVMKCIKSTEEILKKIIDAFAFLKKMKLNDIIKGLMLLFEAVKELFSMLKPCLEGVEKINKLIKAIISANITKIAYYIITHAAEFFFKITNGVACIEKKDYYCIGKVVGDILKLLFLTQQEIHNP